MTTKYSYYKFEQVPCRITTATNGSALAEIYKAGTGFIAGPRLEIEFEGVPISKQKFDAMIMNIIQSSSASS